MNDTDGKNEGTGQKEGGSPVNFTELVMGFSSAALFYLGAVPIEGKEKPEINLPLARQNIDILELLKLKTSGNLSDEEKNLLDHVLNDLRLKFIDAAKE